MVSYSSTVVDVHELVITIHFFLPELCLWALSYMAICIVVFVFCIDTTSIITWEDAIF